MNDVSEGGVCFLLYAKCWKLGGISKGVKTKGLKGFVHDVSLRELEVSGLAEGLMKDDVMPADK